MCLSRYPHFTRRVTTITMHGFNIFVFVSYNGMTNVCFEAFFLEHPYVYYFIYSVVPRPCSLQVLFPDYSTACMKGKNSFVNCLAWKLVMQCLKECILWFHATLETIKLYREDHLSWSLWAPMNKDLKPLSTSERPWGSLTWHLTLRKLTLPVGTHTGWSHKQVLAFICWSVLWFCLI